MLSGISGSRAKRPSTHRNAPISPSATASGMRTSGRSPAERVGADHAVDEARETGGDQ